MGNAGRLGEAQWTVERAAAGPIASFDKRWPLELSSWPGLEAQLAALADDIAYVSHDIDDGLRAGIFTIQDLTAARLRASMSKACWSAMASWNCRASSAN